MPTIHPSFIKLEKGGLDTGRAFAILGAGSNSKVYRGKFKERDCAVKMMYAPEITSQIVSTFRTEAAMLGRLKDAHVVEIYGVLLDLPSIGLVMELCVKSL